MLLHTYMIFIKMCNLFFFWQISDIQPMDQGVTAYFKAYYLQITPGVLIATGLQYTVYTNLVNQTCTLVCGTYRLRTSQNVCNILALPRVTKENSEHVKNKWYPERET
jgi:hypothetical protein